MNLHAVASGAISIVNKLTKVTLHLSTAYTTSSDGRRTATYARVEDVTGQIQPLSAADMTKMDGMDVSTETRKVYLDGRYFGVNRIEAKGGDLVELPSSNEWPYGSLWLVSAVLEQYPDWCCLALVRQRPETAPSD